MFLVFKEGKLLQSGKESFDLTDLDGYELLEVPNTIDESLLVKDILKEDVLKCLNYSDFRLMEYTKLNQDELRFNDLEDNTTTWQDEINAIKAKYPKPLNKESL